MSTSRLLYLNTHHLSAYAWQNGKLRLENSFEKTEEGFNSFSEYLRSHASSTYSLLANVAEEGHVQETIPFLRGKDRETLLTRKIGQHFSGTSLVLTVSLGYEKSKRKNEKVLISALTNPAHFEPWLSRILLTETRLAGIFSTAQLGGILLQKLGRGKGRCILLTAQDHSIRESYLVDGLPVFSRMVPLVDSSIAGIAGSFVAEAEKLYQYLIGQRQISRGETVPVYTVAHPLAVSAIEKAIQNQEHLEFLVIDSHMAADKLGLRTPIIDSSSEHLLLHLLATAPPKIQFADQPLRRIHLLERTRQALITFGVIALVVGSLFTIAEMYQAHVLNEESQALSSKESDLNWRYQEISATFPQLGIDNETLRRITNRHTNLSHQQLLPDAAFVRVSKALSEIPAVQLENIEWKVVSGSSPQGESGQAREITTLRGIIRSGQNATPREILSIFERFIALLGDDEASTVRVQHRPFELESGSTLRGGDSENLINTPRQFTIEIARDIKP